MSESAVMNDRPEAASYLDTFERPEIQNLSALLEEYFQPAVILPQAAPVYTATYDDALFQDRLHEKLTDPRLRIQIPVQKPLADRRIAQRRIAQTEAHPMRRQGDQVERALVS